MRELTRYYGIEVQDPIPLYCNNKETVAFAATPWVGQTLQWADQRNIDLKLLLKRVLDDGPNLLQARHVPAHQDEKYKFSDLGIPAKVNAICDNACSGHLRELRGRKPNIWA